LLAIQRRADAVLAVVGAIGVPLVFLFGLWAGSSLGDPFGAAVGLASEAALVAAANAVMWFTGRRLRRDPPNALLVGFQLLRAALICAIFVVTFPTILVEPWPSFILWLCSPASTLAIPILALLARRRWHAALIVALPLALVAASSLRAIADPTVPLAFGSDLCRTSRSGVDLTIDGSVAGHVDRLCGGTLCTAVAAASPRPAERLEVHLAFTLQHETYLLNVLAPAPLTPSDRTSGVGPLPAHLLLGRPTVGVEFDEGFGANATRSWSDLAGGSGSVTINRSSGRLDVVLTPLDTHHNTQGSVHVSGTWTCAFGVNK
jgi:hypothetical protein